ncbi:DMT family transporter [Rhizobiaceae bacterium n13]|uniref:DMT family transporter n=1 Tax=Ferirhizobium litorale TaxID=2927786 RepID=A0AAE3QCF6_9HYPH|nr:DMT family transporter [Fererhizobium litorale]MDI7860690.1 DMT family transporter [Fererhizobium litorale]MDI7920838.1 DMT family transporter [Fererhizobium litorale]
MKQDVHSPSAHNRHAKGREKLLAHLAMMLFALLIGGSFSLGGLAAQHVPAATLQVMRYLMTIAVLGVMTYGVLRVPFSVPVEPWRFGILGLLMSVYMLTMFLALEITSPVQTGAVFTLMPLMAAGFALVLLGQRTRLGVLASLVIAAIGAIWVIFRGDIGALLRFDVGRGELIYFVGVICHAIYVPLIRKFDRKENPFAFGFWMAVATAFFLLFPAAPQLPTIDYADLPSVVWVALAYLSVVTTAITFLLLQYASLRLPSSKVLAYGYLTPTVVIVMEGLLGHGWASAAVFAGALLTACGLVVMALLPD